MCASAATTKASPPFARACNSAASKRSTRRTTPLSAAFGSRIPTAIRSTCGRKVRSRGVPRPPSPSTRPAITIEIDAPHNAFVGGLWLQDPDGHPINVRPESPKPWRSAPAFAINSPGHYQRAGQRGAPDRHAARPHRLGHVLLHTPRLDQMVAFYIDVLGMKISDRVPGIISFLHLPGGGDHHVIALLADARAGFHHASFEVASPDEIGLGAQQVMGAGYKNGWGFGR